jgi:hypothetical protein
MFSALVQAAVLAPLALATHHHAPAQHVTVQSGDSLSSIAVARCGKANDWTGIWAHSRAIVGPDPNLILPGQRLKVVCEDPPSLLQYGQKPVHAAAAPAPATATRTDPWDGKKGACGDGDGDGYDMPCSALHGGSDAVQAQAPAAPVRAAASFSGGSYSYSALEQLWMSAGGPSFAAAQAAQIAMCESGGDPRAYNPSGASGLWQILGQVVGGDVFNPYTNALNAVSKFRASGDTFAQWVCQ